MLRRLRYYPYLTLEFLDGQAGKLNSAMKILRKGAKYLGGDVLRERYEVVRVG